MQNCSDGYKCVTCRTVVTNVAIHALARSSPTLVRSRKLGGGGESGQGSSSCQSTNQIAKGGVAMK